MTELARAAIACGRLKIVFLFGPIVLVINCHSTGSSCDLESSYAIELIHRLKRLRSLFFALRNPA